MTEPVPRLIERMLGKGLYAPLKHLAKRLLCMSRGLTDTGVNVYVSPLARVVGSSRIRMGDSAVAYRHAVLHAGLDGSRIDIGEGTIILDYASLYTVGGFIKIGRGCSVNNFCVLYGHGGLTIGHGVSIAAHTVIVPANHRFDDTGVPIKLQGETKKGITIGDDVWIGANVTVLDGVTIGSGSVVGAGSVVTRDVPPMSVVAGNPARVLRRRGDPR